MSRLIALPSQTPHWSHRTVGHMTYNILADTTIRNEGGAGIQLRSAKRRPVLCSFRGYSSSIGSLRILPSPSTLLSCHIKLLYRSKFSCASPPKGAPLRERSNSNSAILKGWAPGALDGLKRLYRRRKRLCNNVV